MRKTSPTQKVSSTKKDKSSYHPAELGQQPMKKSSSTVIVVLLLLCGVSAALAIYFYQQVNILRADPQTSAQKEARELVARVAKLIVLPEGEVPTIATVTDPELLQDQAFFANSKKGDKVLIYTNARKAILYSPVDNKIVEVAPINIGNPQPAPPAGGQTSGTETPPTGGPTP